MKEKLAAFKVEMGEIWDLNMAGALLGWDQQTNMPPNGAEERSEQLATLSKIAHHKATSDEIGKMLDELLVYAKSLEPDSDDARLIRRSKIDFDKMTRVPSEKVAEFARVTTLAQEKWVQARAKSDFSIFRKCSRMKSYSILAEMRASSVCGCTNPSVSMRSRLFGTRTVCPMSSSARLTSRIFS